MDNACLLFQLQREIYRIGYALCYRIAEIFTQLFCSETTLLLGEGADATVLPMQSFLSACLQRTRLSQKRNKNISAGMAKIVIVQTLKMCFVCALYLGGSSKQWVECTLLSLCIYGLICRRAFREATRSTVIKSLNYISSQQ